MLRLQLDMYHNFFACHWPDLSLFRFSIPKTNPRHLDFPSEALFDILSSQTLLEAHH